MKKFLICLILLAASLAAHAQYDKDVFYYRGRNALADGKYSKAIENFNILARLDTTDYWTFFFRGIAKYNLGDIRGAHTDFERSVRINPVFTNGFHYRAITLSREGKYDEALADLEKAIMLRPEYMGLYFSRGVTYFLAQRFENAIEDFDHYIRKEPKDPSAYLNRGASWLFLNDTTKALTDYNKAIKMDRFEPEGYIRRGRLYAAKKQYGDAIADMNQAISLDSTNTFAYFNRALMYYDMHDYNAAMRDLNRVLEDEPGNALTLYNRSLISAQVGDFDSALQDMDRVLNINPGNVLAWFNRATFFTQMGRWMDAYEDYTKAIELYPDFAKAYMNRSYVENMMGHRQASKADYETAQQKVREYRAKNSTDEGSFADTTKKYSALLSLDADFAKKDFDNELLQHRDIDIRLKPLYKMVLAKERPTAGSYAISRRYENALVDRISATSPIPVIITNKDSLSAGQSEGMEALLSGTGIAMRQAWKDFLRGMYEVSGKQYSTALSYYDKAIEGDASGTYDPYYRAFYLMNRAALRADMIDFISSIESTVQTLSMDAQGTSRARVSDDVNRTYDYSEAIADLEEAAKILPDLPYIWFDLGNIYILSSQLVNSISSYDKAISLYPYMGDAYFNRGLVLIYLKDKEKGCIDLSRAGEMGVRDAYSVISKYCEKEENR